MYTSRNYKKWAIQMKKVLAFLLIAILTVTTACGTNLTKPKSESNKGGTNISRKQPTDVMNARTNFAFSLYPHVLLEQPNENIFVSPISIMSALTMAYNGSYGETRAAMETTLELDGASLEEMNQANQNVV